MLALFFLPAILGVAFVVNVLDDDEEDDTPAPEPQTVSDGFVGTAAAELLNADAAGGAINGAGGNDTIVGSDLDDTIIGGTGNDVVFAQGGDDVVSGDKGNDRVFLGDGDDVYAPVENYPNTAGDDLVRGGAGNDFIVDLLGSNTLFGDLGRDVLISFDGLSEIGNYDDPAEFRTTDTLSGGFGSDFLAGDDGDVMTGGAGADFFIAADDEDRMDDDALREVRITDFNTDEDTLVVLQLDGVLSDDILYSYDATANAVRASYEGRQIALLEGLTAADIPTIQSALVSLNDFNQLAV